MVTTTLKFPTDEEKDLLRRFTVNRNYLQAAAGFITTTYGRREKLYAGLRTTVEAMPPYQRIQRGQADLDEVRRFLTLAWTSEIQLHLPAIMDNPSMLAFANTWAPVHAYYAVYGTLQAWFAANGMTGVADDHTATLRTISTQIDQRDLSRAVEPACDRLPDAQGANPSQRPRQGLHEPHRGALNPDPVRRGPRVLAAAWGVATQHP